ncbi:MAG: aldose 1-epimerase family protein [Eubacteriales bacterium]|nr:aldose 1-epimerase family protein [Eubacteriales bacterium]
MQFEITSGESKAVLGLDGAQLNSLMKDGKEYLWQGNSDFWAGQAPVCFPINGVLPEGKATAFGKECNMKRHGVARISPFELFEEHKNSVTFIQKSSDETKKAFPFDYELKIKYTINGDTVTNEYIITNTGKDKLPFTIGGHPAFNCPVDDDECFEDYKVIFDEDITEPCLRPDHHSGLVDTDKKYDVMHGSNTLKMEHNLFEENDALIFENCSAKSVTLVGKKGKGIKVEFQDMRNLLIWSAVGNAPFVALEPWTGISSCLDEDGIFEHKRGMTILEPDETISFKFKITMI